MPRGAGETLGRTLDRFRAKYETNPISAKSIINHGDSAVDGVFSAPELAAWTTIGSLLLNLDETITKD
jgi:hypothetical protein